MLFLPCTPVAEGTGNNTGICKTVLSFLVFLLQGLGCVFLGICVELAWHDCKQAILKAGFHLTTNTCDTSACWVPTHPCTLFFKGKPFQWGPGAGNQATVPDAVLGLSSCFIPPLSQECKVAVGDGDWGCVPQSHQPCHCWDTFREEEEEEKGREEMMKLPRSARERREEGGWSLVIFFSF